MTRVQVYDPAMCCSTGVCGPAVDPALARFAADLEWLKSKGAGVERYNLAHDLSAFSGQPLVKAALNHKGTACLPLVLLNGTVFMEGAYPTREQLAQAAGIRFEAPPPSLVGIGGLSKAGR